MLLPWSVVSTLVAHIAMRGNGMRRGVSIGGRLFLLALAVVGGVLALVRHRDSGPVGPSSTQVAEPSPSVGPAREEKAAPGPDLAGVSEALVHYRAGEIAAGDAALRRGDPLVRAAIEWDVLRQRPADAGLPRLAAFLRGHADWPQEGLRRGAETLPAADSAQADRALAFLSEFPPLTPSGQVVWASLLKNDPARASEADALARQLWRGSDLTPVLEAALVKNFSAVLTEEDHWRRFDRLVMRGQMEGASRAAMLAGKDAEALFRVEADLLSGVPFAQVSGRVPEQRASAPGLLFARIRAARKAGRIDEAATLLLKTPRAAEAIAPDAFSLERRAAARKLLDSGEAARAYDVSAGHAAVSDEARQESEFLAGWIALRFLSDPIRAAPHFERLADASHSPQERARAAWWRGRAAEGQAATAKAFFVAAAEHSESFYGQLARARLGLAATALRPAPAAAEGAARLAPVRAADLLFSLGEKDAALALALEAAQTLPPDHLAALGRVAAAQNDPHIAVLIANPALLRGVALDELGYPIDGVPAFAPLAHSAPRPVVLAIARQESAFDPAARSGAGALGLMQMMPATARSTAKEAGLPFDEARLTADPVYNAQLGAFHLGQLLGAFNGAHVLAFAAYNAGPRNARAWIAAFGDPRDPNVDPIDWMERIPFAETRHYVQRVVENLHLYRARLGDPTPDLFTSDLRRGVAAQSR
jgi:soluble lytic murein transglycosylase